MNGCPKNGQNVEESDPEIKFGAGTTKDEKNFKNLLQKSLTKIFMHNSTLKIGLFAIGLEAYWEQFSGLKGKIGRLSIGGK